MATEVIATEGEAIYAWMIWILPFIAALIIPAGGKFQKFQLEEALLDLLQ